MKRLLALSTSLALIIFYCTSQTYLKWNAAYWAVGITNMSVETRLAAKWTFNSDLVISPWESIDNSPFLFGMILPEARFYPKRAFNGFYIGIFGAAQIFKMTKWNYINTGKYQKGRGFGAGLSLGYEVKINDKWNIDVFGGWGWQNSQYWGYYTNNKEKYKGWNGSGEWMPYKIGVSFAYRL